MLAKSYGNGFYREDYNGDGVLEGFNNFLDRHTFCGDSGDEGDYILEYEHTPMGQDMDGMQQWREGFLAGLQMMKTLEEQDIDELKKRLFGEETV